MRGSQGSWRRQGPSSSFRLLGDGLVETACGLLSELRDAHVKRTWVRLWPLPRDLGPFRFDLLGDRFHLASPGGAGDLPGGHASQPVILGGVALVDRAADQLALLRVDVRVDLVV